ncbi:uncharacterized protein FOMMEDRAFT_143550 [Fomitiporia mediterranea MF3/22]|uniref:uncharacterized protein n=1 Tax=Fomitiporia mediterranea (strain MF3/22) TaxID=694068 RepID=UPI00044088AC|nr:uncharacterized protein FOMMEDRAFT_143550 [Fomitiporia mediterranea MF3/22]EJC98102.1 hypothetical protein FOMMEDRAFT_143550 [Fomitiporia mediterranea MF3/22]
MRGNVVRGRGQPISSETHATHPPHHKAHQVIQGRGRGGTRKTYEQQRQHAAQGNNETNAPSNVHSTTPTTRPTGGQVQSHDDHSKPLHPSWEAKRKLKEKLNPAIVPATGTKIKFT